MSSYRPAPRAEWRSPRARRRSLRVLADIVSHGSLWVPEIVSPTPDLGFLHRTDLGRTVAGPTSTPHDQLS
jgi:hypothetical protein